MGIKKSPVDEQAERVIEALKETERTGQAPAFVRDNPGQFLREMYDVWHRMGGKEGGRWRNSIRKMRDEWLTGRNAVPSLHPKLMGRVKVTRSDARSLLDLFLERWRIAVGDDPAHAITVDGYVAFAARDMRKLKSTLLSALMKAKTSSNGLKMPEQSNGHDVVEETKRRWVDVEQTLREANALITLSRHRIAIGSSNVETIKNFWHFLNHLYQSAETETQDRIFIWVIDVGSRTVEQENSFDEFFNAGLLSLQFQAFATFDSLNDYEEHGHSRLFPRLRIAEAVHRDQRWEWLCERTVIVAQNLRHEEFDGLYPDQNMAPNSIRLKDIGVTAEHILPNKAPREWIKQLRSLYGRHIEAADATFTVFIKNLQNPSATSQRDLRYFAHTPIPEGQKPADDPQPNVAHTARSVELQSPGQDYDDAFRLTYLAARFRLGFGDERERTEGLTALAYVRRHGFRFLLLKDFLKIFSTKS